MPKEVVRDTGKEEERSKKALTASDRRSILTL